MLQQCSNQHQHLLYTTHHAIYTAAIQLRPWRSVPPFTAAAAASGLLGADAAADEQPMQAALHVLAYTGDILDAHDSGEQHTHTLTAKNAHVITL